MNRQFQKLVSQWVGITFGDVFRHHYNERAKRFLEESLELVQSIGLTEDEAVALVRHVYNRDPGKTEQELGGVMVTLAALAECTLEDAEECGLNEFDRCITNTGRIREKHWTKPAAIRSNLEREK